MMKSPVTLSTMALFAGLCVIACSSAPTPAETPEEEFVEVPAEEQPAFEPDVPEYRDLGFLEETPELTDEVEADGVYSFRIGHLEVIHMPTPANEVVSARLYFGGGSANLNDELTGIERLALAVAVNGGTESTPKDEFNARLDAVGSSVGFLANRDFSAITMQSVRPHFDETWELFTEAIFEPAFPDDEVELRRDRQLASIASIVDNPDRLVSEVARDLTFQNHPYYYRQLGTEETVSQFTTDHVRAWQRNMIAPERMLLVVVGNIERDDLIEKVQAGPGRLAPTDTAKPELPGIWLERPALRVEKLDLPTNYILGYFAGPAIGDDDYPAMVLATQHLRDRLFEEVRTRRNLTYAVSSGIGQRGDNVGFLYVTAVDPAATMPVIFDEVERLQEELIDREQLDMVRNVYVTRHYQGLETNSSIAGQLARAHLVGGDWRYSHQFLDGIREVTPEDIQRVAQTYMKNYHFGVVGDPDAVPPELFGVEEADAETVDEIDDDEVDMPDEVPAAEEPAPSPPDA